MTRTGWLATAVWAALVAAATVVVVFAHYTTDLSAFLPRSPTATQRLLVDQLREGIASRLILVGIEGADSAARARLRAIALARRLVPELEAKQLDPLDLFYAHQVHFEHQRELAKVGVEHRTPRRDKAYWNSVVGDGKLRAAAERRPWQ